MPARLAAILALLLTAAVASAAQDDRKATVELVVAKETVRPGEQVPVGVRFTMQPGWHVYWKNPGDAGTPPRFSWNLPGGGAGGLMRGGEWSASDPLFPTPVRFEDGGGLVGYGYGEVVIFPATLTVPGNATPGQSVDVTVTADYLICADVCLQESAAATATLTVGPDAGDPPTPEADAIALAVDSVPVPVESSRLVESAEVRDLDEPGLRELAVEFAGPTDDAGFFPDPPDGMEVSVESIEHVRDRMTVRFRTRALSGARITEPKFEAVIGFTAAGERRGVTADIPIRDAVDE